MGAVAVGLGGTVLAGAAVASADAGSGAGARVADTSGRAAQADQRKAGGSSRVAGAVGAVASRSPRPAATVVRNRPSAVAAIRTAPRAASVVAPSVPSVPSAAQTASATSVGPLGAISAFFGLPGAPATAAPSLGSIPILVRLTLEDLFTGTPPAAVSNPTAVVTGLFNQVLRKDPTSEELDNYLGVIALTGVNGVIAGLYSSTSFRQTEVNNYYLELLGRNATDRELDWGTTRLMWGLPEPLFAASIAGEEEFYQASSAGGGTAGLSPSAATFVDNLYRSLLGATADPGAAAAYIQQLQDGMPTELAAWQFVTTDAFRQAKVQEVYSVLGQTATQAEVTAAVQNWFWDGGLAGIATSLLATEDNVARIQNGLVSLPDMTAAAQLQQLLLAAYTEDADGFVKTLNSLLNVDENNPCPSSPTCNTALYTLLTTGGPDRGLANGAITVTYGTADVSTLIPTQNEIDLAKSLKYPLRDPVQLAAIFAGGVITPGAPPIGSPVVTSDGGTYIVDGHHRWSSIYLINPFTQVKSVDIGYVPSPQTGLKETQIGVAAELGYLKVSPGGGINVYTCTRAEFDAGVADFIDNNPVTADIPLVYQVFTDNLGLTGTDAEKLVKIQDYLWTNVQRMRSQNPFIPGATNREVMPQGEPLKPILSLMASGLLSYSFPIVSFLG